MLKPTIHSKLGNAENQTYLPTHKSMWRRIPQKSFLFRFHKRLLPRFSLYKYIQKWYKTIHEKLSVENNQCGRTQSADFHRPTARRQPHLKAYKKNKPKFTCYFSVPLRCGTSGMFWNDVITRNGRSKLLKSMALLHSPISIQINWFRSSLTLKFRFIYRGIDLDCRRLDGW